MNRLEEIIELSKKMCELCKAFNETESNQIQSVVIYGRIAEAAITLDVMPDGIKGVPVSLNGGDFYHLKINDSVELIAWKDEKV